jgi:CBS domain containing-hemolysin-like protein
MIPSALGWLLLALVGFTGSALYSGLETGAYRLNRVRLQIREHRHERAARTLRRLLATPTTLLTTLLIGNNIANYLGATALTVLLERFELSDWQVILLNVALITPILFVFGETLPKDLFAAHADRLMYPLAWVLSGSQRLFKCLGLLALIGAFTTLAMRLFRGHAKAQPFHPRRHVEALVKEGLGHGLISDEQSLIVERALSLSRLTLEQEMTPWKRVVTVKADEPAARLWTLAQESPRTRFPVVDGQGAVVGLVDLKQVLSRGRAAAQGQTIAQGMKPPFMLERSLPLREALRQLQRGHEALAIVTDRGQPVGVASVKDLIEPIVGELANW